MKLALFDLDHTLIPFDSGMAWTHFLVEAGVLPASADAQYLAHARADAAGTLDIHALHRASVAPLSRIPRSTLAQWTRDFEARMASRLPSDMRELVQRHRDAGDLCAIVTATPRFIAQPFARLFGLAHVLATEAATADGTPEGAFTGEIAGLPCFREHKVARVRAWLAREGPPGFAALEAFDASWFYSDSASDLPLLQAVSRPVAVRPDGRLREHALRVGWPIVESA